MNPKTTIGLVLSLILAGVGVWWARSSSTPTAVPSPVGPKALLDLKFADVTQYEIRSGSDTAWAFTKTDNTWEMVSPFGGPSESTTVDADVRKLTGLEYTQVFSSGDSDGPTDEMTSLGHPQRIFKLAGKDGKSETLEIGNRQTLSNKTYVRKQGDDAIYLVAADLNKDFRRKLSDYRTKRVSEFAAADAVRVSVRGEENFSLVKQGSEWTVESPVKARAETAVVSRLLQGVSSLRVTEFVADDAKTLKPYGLENPRLTVTITTEKKTPKPAPPPPATMPAEPAFEIVQKTIGVAFGGGDDEKVFAKLDDTGNRTVFQVGATVLKDLKPALDDLRDKRIAVIPTNREQGIRVSSGVDSIVLAKAGSDWRIASGIDGIASDSADFTAVSELLKSIRDIRAIGFESVEISSFGFGRPRAVLEIAMEGRVEPVRLLIGNPTPSKTGAYIKNESEGFIAVVPSADADTLVVEPISFLDRAILSVDGARATRVELERSGGMLHTLERAGSGWRMIAPESGNADLSAVTKILANLSNLRARRVVANSGDTVKYGLNNPQSRVSVTILPTPKPTTQPAEGAPAELEPPMTVTLLVNRHEGKVYAMKEGGATIGEIDSMVLANLEAELMDTKVISLVPEQAVRIAFSGGDEFAFVKSGDQWNLMGESTFKTDGAKITELLDHLKGLRALKYERYSGADLARYGLDSPALALRVAFADGSSSVLMVSADGPSGGDRYANVSSHEGRVFVLKAQDLKNLQKKITDFQKTG